MKPGSAGSGAQDGSPGSPPAVSWENAPRIPRNLISRDNLELMPPRFCQPSPTSISQLDSWIFFILERAVFILVVKKGVTSLSLQTPAPPTKRRAPVPFLGYPKCHTYDSIMANPSELEKESTANKGLGHSPVVPL